MSYMKVNRKGKHHNTMNDNVIFNPEKMSRYKNYVYEQKDGFLNCLEYINEQLCILKRYGIISEHTVLTARIKSLESAMKNDSKKALDDVFGLEIITGTEAEAAFVVTFLREILETSKETIHNKDNNYRAHHFLGYPEYPLSVLSFNWIVLKEKENFESWMMFDDYIDQLSKKALENTNKEKIMEYCDSFCDSLNKYKKTIYNNLKGKRMSDLKNELKDAEDRFCHKYYLSDEEKTPIVEFQIKTIDTAMQALYGTAKHSEYKGDSPRQAQKIYDNNLHYPKEKLPIMYESKLKYDENDKPIPPRLLEEEEILKKLYPTIILKTNKEKKAQLEKLRNKYHFTR